MNVINYLADTLDAITHTICVKQSCIPLTIKHFIKGIYEDGLANGQGESVIYERMAHYLIEGWLAKVAFKEMVENGFIKVFNI